MDSAGAAYDFGATDGGWQVGFYAIVKHYGWAPAPKNNDGDPGEVNDL